MMSSISHLGSAQKDAVKIARNQTLAAGSSQDPYTRDGSSLSVDRDYYDAVDIKLQLGTKDVVTQVDPPISTRLAAIRHEPFYTPYP